MTILCRLFQAQKDNIADTTIMRGNYLSQAEQLVLL